MKLLNSLAVFGLTHIMMTQILHPIYSLQASEPEIVGNDLTK